MRFLCFEDLADKGIKFSRPHIFRLIQQKRFPRPVKLSVGGNVNGWVESEIDEYLAARLAERDATTPAATAERALKAAKVSLAKRRRKASTSREAG